MKKKYIVNDSIFHGTRTWMTVDILLEKTKVNHGKKTILTKSL